MGFLSGSATFSRFRISDDPTGVFGEEHLELLSKNKINSNGRNLHEQPCVGFLGGAHILDTQFDFEKNIIGEAMRLAYADRQKYLGDKDFVSVPLEAIHHGVGRVIGPFNNVDELAFEFVPNGHIYLARSLGS